MTDPLNQTEILLDNLLETIRHIKHLNKQFSNDSFIQNILMNTNENEIQKQIKEFNIHSYSLQILTNLSYSINQFDHLQQQFQDIKNSVVSQMNEIHQQMQNKCKQCLKLYCKRHFFASCCAFFHRLYPFQSRAFAI